MTGQDCKCGMRATRLHSRALALLQVAFLFGSLFSPAFGGLHSRDEFGDPVLLWPLWYKDTDTPSGKMLTLCKSTTNPDMCLPVEPDPNAFFGNVGPEIFFYNAEVLHDGANAGINLRYQAALEAAYANEFPNHGDELVFSRLRFIVDVNDAACASTLTITHPYGVHVFEAGVGPRAVVSTTDKWPLRMDFDAARIEGDVGPWLVRELGPITMPNGEEFIGDPTVPTTFTGSPFGTNYVKVESSNPACVLDPAQPVSEQNILILREASIQGQIYQGPILVPTKVISAVYTPITDPNNGFQTDVLVTATENNELWLSGVGFPATKMSEIPAGSGNYRAHVQSDSRLSQLYVHNIMDPTPIVTKPVAVSDAVNIIFAEYMAGSQILCVYARSSDPDSVLTAEGFDNARLSASSNCNSHGVASDTYGPGAMAVSITVPNTQGMPGVISVISNNHGRDSSLVHVLPALVNPTFNNDLDQANPPSVTNFEFVESAQKPFPAAGFTIDFYGSSSRRITWSGNPAAWPSPDVQLYVVEQPALGMVSGPGEPRVPVSSNGQLVFYPAPDMPLGVHTLEFQYIVLDKGTTPAQSDVATVTIKFTVQAPPSPPPPPPLGATTFEDEFAVRTGTARIIDVLSNDVQLNSGTPLDRTALTLTVTQQPGAAGTVSVNSDKTLTYTARANTGGTSEFFTYTVQHPTGYFSKATRVDVSIPAGAESLSVKAARYRGGANGANGQWTIEVTENTPAGWVGATPTFTLSTQVHCFLTGLGTGVTGTTLTGAPNPDTIAIAYIGSAPFGTQTKTTISATAGTLVTNPLNPNAGLVEVPGTGTWAAFRVQCATSNYYGAAVFPSKATPAQTNVATASFRVG